MSYSSIITLAVIFMIAGVWLKAFTPKHRNFVIGYRSPISMSCEKAWIEGNKFSGSLLLIGGFIFLMVTLICRYILPDSKATMAILPTILALITVGTIIWTEIHLRKYMNKSGENRELMM